jgi:branched-chain amino acid transport system ATP-binding protein
MCGWASTCACAPMCSRRCSAFRGTGGRTPKSTGARKSFSYGHQRKLEIARALATGPRLLLLDEPAAGMNPEESSELMVFIRRLQREFGLTILLIEHDMKVVMGICERLAVLDHGLTIARGTPEEIQNNTQVIEAYLGTGEHNA